MVTKKLKNSYLTLIQAPVLAFLMFAVIGCASSSNTTPSGGALAEADLFDAFKEGKEGKEGDEANGAEVSDTSSDADDNIVSGTPPPSFKNASQSLGAGENFDYYYRALGGESVQRIAYTLYDSDRAIRKLLRMNPKLKAKAPVPSETKVYFNMGTVSPRSEMLTRDLIERYGEQLSERIQLKRSQQFGNEKYAEVTVKRGDTLQAISERVFGTTRLWAELYLLNQDRIADYDQLEVEVVLRYYPEIDFKRPVVATNYDTPTREVASVETNSQKAANADPVAQKGNADSAVHGEALVDANNNDADAAFSGTVANKPPRSQVNRFRQQSANSGLKTLRPLTGQAQQDEGGIFAQIRRLIYVGIVLLIVIGGYFLTRLSQSNGFRRGKFGGIQPPTPQSTRARPEVAAAVYPSRDIGSSSGVRLNKRAGPS